jgi:hypothetical protein
MSAPANTSATAPPTAATPATPVTLPSPQVLLNAAKLAMEQQKPIQLDYYQDTVLGKAFLGEDASVNQKMLVKSNEEYTSLVQKVYKVGEDYIVMTENSLYLVSGKIQKRRIQVAALRGF